MERVPPRRDGNGVICFHDGDTRPRPPGPPHFYATQSQSSLSAAAIAAEHSPLCGGNGHDQDHQHQGAPAAGGTSSQRSRPKTSATAIVSPKSERRPNWSGRRCGGFDDPLGSVTVGLYFSQTFNCSTAASTSLRRFSNRANIARIAAPRAMPQTYQTQVWPRSCAGYQIMLEKSNTRNVNPRNRNDRTRNMIPANMPATPRAP